MWYEGVQLVIRDWVTEGMAIGAGRTEDVQAAAVSAVFDSQFAMDLLV